MLVSTPLPTYHSCASHAFQYELDFAGKRPQQTVCMPYLCPRERFLTNEPLHLLYIRQQRHFDLSLNVLGLDYFVSKRGERWQDTILTNYWGVVVIHGADF